MTGHESPVCISLPTAFHADCTTIPKVKLYKNPLQYATLDYKHGGCLRVFYISTGDS